MALAKHIQIARTQGVEAGLEAYMDTPSSKMHPAYKTITKKRTPQTKLDAYCTLFADQLGKIDQQTGVQQDRKNDAVQALTEQLAALQAQIDGLEGAEAEPEFDEVTVALANRLGVDPAKIAELGLVAAVAPSAPSIDVGVITKGEAWEVLSEADGNTDFPRPNDPTLPATNGQLYRLNVLGFLSIESE